MGNAEYSFVGSTAYGKLANDITFMFDTACFNKIQSTKWYPSYESGRCYLIDRSGRKMHSYLLDCPQGYEIDHKNLNTLDNRLDNLRICTHQQNQINQPLQRNNTSGISGVSWYAPRNKFRARIKIGQKDIHLGYYQTFEEAIQARNVGMECMFGEFGIYNAVPSAPEWIQKIVREKCKRFAALSVSKAFLLTEGVVWNRIN